LFFDAFRKYFERYGFDVANGCNICDIVFGFEMLYDVTRNSMEKVLNRDSG
jgi:hypothetical protein